MTIATEPVPISYDGDAVTVAFPVSFKYFAKADVKVTYRSIADVETLWVLDTDYSLTAAGVSSGGTLTAVVAPVVGASITIEIDPANTQTESMPLGGKFPSLSVESALDRGAQRDAKLERLWERSLRVPTSDEVDSADLELPIDSVRALMLLGFDSSGAVQVYDPATLDVILTSAVGKTLVQQVTQALMLTVGLGVDADLRTFSLPASTTITAAAATVLDDATVAAMVDTLGGAAAQGSGGIVRKTSATLTTPLVNVIGEETAAAGVTIDGVLHKDGGLDISGALAASGNIIFPATQVASAGANTLDDYEEGTWTPIDSSGASLSFTTVTARYVKVGKQVLAGFRLTYPVTANGAANVIGGLPFTSATVANLLWGAAPSLTSLTTASTFLVNTAATTFQQFSTSLGQYTNVQLSAITFAAPLLYEASA